MAVQMHQGSLPHIFWIDLDGDGTFTECAVMKRDPQGNIYFFPLNALDQIDKNRMAKIVANRNANAFELWDLMSQVTLNNGVNALDYFHQLVEVITPTGRRMTPREGVVGTDGAGMIDLRGKDAREQAQAQADIAAQAAAQAAAAAAAAAVRGQTPAPAAMAEAAPAPAAEPAPAKKRTTRRKAASAE